MQFKDYLKLSKESLISEGTALTPANLGEKKFKNRRGKD